MTKPLNSPIKWVGGKRWLAPKVADLYAPHTDRRFVELFAGGLGLSFQLRPKRVLANDLNQQLINFYYWMRREPNQHLTEFVNTEEEFYKNRARYNELISIGGAFLEGKEIAELFYYLNRTCFNGLYRVNQRGKFNTPYGKYKSPMLLTDLGEYAQIAKDWTFTSMSYEVAMNLVNDDDFLFIDPPYDDTFVGYQDGGFNWEQQVDLAQKLGALSVPVVATNNATPRIVELYTDLGFTIEYVERRHKVNPGKEGSERPLEAFMVKNL